MSNFVSKSFRDPDGITIDDGQRILRLLRGTGLTKLGDLAESPVAEKFIADGKLIRTELLQGREAEIILSEFEGNWLGVAQHDRIPFITYPHEWPAEMLHAAANLTLELAQDFLQEGYGLKDATPYNILFRGAKPAFIDVLSIEKRQPLDPIWRAEAQFIRNFILPLLCWNKFGIPPNQLLLNGQDGITPEFVYKISGIMQRMFPPFLWWVNLPVWLGAQAERKTISQARKTPIARSPEMARFILGRSFKRLKRALAKVAPRQSAASHWQKYEQTWLYTEDQVTTKKQFISSVLGSLSNSRILDIGCNVGSYSLMASAHGHQVVAFDADPTVAGIAWRRAAQEKADMSILTANFADPTPATGWMNEECRALLPRLSNHFDVVIGLAVMHHLIVTSGIPLAALFEQLAKTTKKYLLLEYIDPSDQNFEKISRGRDDLYGWLNQQVFEEQAKSYFKIERKTEVIPGQRILYLFSKYKVT
ncbi:MAG: class I SAM-dependent methyltransferase [Rhodospirillaceae bacterium]|nr:class I SAM-dependent methyltransferase [Rhodospirillaceae bacterium]MBT5940968.1 class I SAM-dependent methyltransferase [Rhodospirillaceae bacterium]